MRLAALQRTRAQLVEDSVVQTKNASRSLVLYGDDPNPLCKQCPGAKLDQPFLRLVFIEGDESNLEGTMTEA